MRFCLMIEGQEDVTWDQWRALAAACESHGIEALLRSDHYLSVEMRVERGSLDAWATLSALAAVTSRIRLGTLVSPATFRHPSVLAKLVTTVDHVSGGRAELGIGAGWHEAEHRAYGIPFPDTRTRMDVLEEQLEIVTRSWQDGAFSFSGRHYSVEGLDALPKPLQRPRPNLIVGSRGGPRSARLAARFADEFNTFHAPPAEIGERFERVAAACEDAGRDRSTMTFSAMLTTLVGRDRADFERRLDALAERRGAASSVEVGDDWVAGTVDEAADRLREFERAGVERVMLQHHLHDDVEMVELIGRELVPRFR